MSPPLRRPSAIVISEEDNTFVKDDICIRAFDKNGKFVRNIGRDALQKPFGKLYFLPQFAEN